MSTDARPLAHRLAAASDAQLEDLLRVRSVRPDVDWDDFFDAAEALLEPASLERALAALTRAEARTLKAAVDANASSDASETPPSDATADALVAFGLTDATGRVLPPVAALVASAPAIDDDPPAATAEASSAVAARAAERAFTTIGALADMLLAARSTPLSLVATGALSASQRRRFAETEDPADVRADDIRTLAEMTGLARSLDRELRVTGTAESWIDSPFAARWAQVVEAFRGALPRGVRSGDGWIAAEQWPQAHPWDAGWPDRAAHLRTLAIMLGLLAEDGTEPPWAAALRAGGAADTAPLEALLPTEVDRLFLQNDLTAIAPGPLQPALDNRLRAMTEHESAAQASSYRFTADSIARALVEGETELGILEFLREVSLTGVPQPLEYLVAQTAARHGLVRVGPDATGGTIVSSDDSHLLEAIAVDRNLRPMGLVRDGDRLRSRVSAQTVAWALTDARYPATMVDSDGAGVAADRSRVAAADHPEGVSYAPLIARLRARQGPDADAAWLDRELEAAVRARALVLVEVAMPDGSSRELTLEASGVGGGRLRGRDRAADVERTLPVRSIRSVRMLES